MFGFSLKPQTTTDASVSDLKMSVDDMQTCAALHAHVQPIMLSRLCLVHTNGALMAL